MPRAGLTGDDVVASAAGLADEIGFQGVTMGLLADRLGVRAPSLYKHVDGLADVQHRLATLTLAELGEAIVAALSPGLGTLKLLDGAGHYPHAERPNELAALITNFLTEHHDA